VSTYIERRTDVVYDHTTAVCFTQRVTTARYWRRYNSSFMHRARCSQKLELREQFEAGRAENRIQRPRAKVSFFGKGQRAPYPPARDLGSTASSPRGIWDKIKTKNVFGHEKSPQTLVLLHIFCVGLFLGLWNADVHPCTFTLWLYACALSAHIIDTHIGVFLQRIHCSRIINSTWKAVLNLRQKGKKRNYVVCRLD